MYDTCEETELHITSKKSREPITLCGDLHAINDNPKKVQQLLDLLDMPKGTEVKVVTKAASVIVR